jgi:chaperonin GroES
MARPKKSKTPKLIPTPGFVLIEPQDIQKKTQSGIYLPDTHDEKPQQAKVLAVGPDQITEKGNKIPAPCKVGDTVIYKKWGGDEVKLGVGEKEYIFVKFEDILALVK